MGYAEICPPYRISSATLVRVTLLLFPLATPTAFPFHFGIKFEKTYLNSFPGLPGTPPEGVYRVQRNDLFETGLNQVQ